MSKEKILREHQNIIIYSKDDWALLKKKRHDAIKLLEMFTKEGLNPFVYGSVARGYVHEYSDIDIIFIQQIPTFQIELILNQNGYDKYFREIIMATPNDSIKLYIYLSELDTISIPISKSDKKLIEFYDFGGKIDLKQLKSDVRVAGIDKRLVLIRPNSNGHEEFSIINNESIAANETGVNIETVNERKRVLLKREKYGRTGVFLKRPIELHESTEEVLKILANKSSFVRKKLFIR